MKIRRCLPFILTFLLLIGSVAMVSVGKDESTSSPSQVIKEAEMRGVWVPYMSLDVENADDTKKAFIETFTEIVNESQQNGFNAVIVQVRPFCDALYRSDYFPWSHILTGIQGKDPGFDPLTWMCATCHEHGLQLHAWINPYRVGSKNTPKTFSDDHPYQKNPNMGFVLDDAIYLDPANEQARTLIVSGVREIVTRYDVDGIQFDDYFYPEKCGDFDQNEYESYCKETASALSLSSWRKENVNILIREVYKTVHEQNGIVFGISPQGNLGNNDALYADVKQWCKTPDYIDYICPQLYFSLDNPALTFEDGLADWLNIKKHSKLKLYAGLAGYKAGSPDADAGTWADNTDILASEISVLRKQGLNGFMLYSYDSLKSDQTKDEIQNVVRYLSNSPSQ